MFVNIRPKKPSTSSKAEDPPAGLKKKGTAKINKPTVLRRESRGNWTVERTKWEIDRQAIDELLDSLEALNQKDRDEGLDIFSQSVENFFAEGAEQDRINMWSRRQSDDLLKSLSFDHFPAASEKTALRPTSPLSFKKSQPPTAAPVSRKETRPGMISRALSLTPYEERSHGVVMKTHSFREGASDLEAKLRSALHPDEDDNQLYYDLLMKQAEARAGLSQWTPTAFDRALMEAKKKGKKADPQKAKLAKSLPDKIAVKEETSRYTNPGSKTRYYELMMERARAISKGKKWSPASKDDEELILANSLSHEKYAEHVAKKKGKMVDAGELSDDDWLVMDSVTPTAKNGR